VADRSATFWIALFLFVVVAGCIHFDRPPAAVPASAGGGEFSAERALVHLNAFAKAPHPIGSEEHDRSRDYLVAQLKVLGLTPEIQRTTGVTTRYQAAGTIENIVARWKGSGGGSDAVALLAHYDSVPAGPGAGDDGSGVAAWLEVFRALRNGPPLRNDIILLFTDGEEAGLLGASAFVAEHPWAKDVRVVVNLEARGNAGPSQLFETSQDNGRLLEMFAQAAPHAAGTSLTYEIYKHMPNDTDMTLFKKAGNAGLNFAFIGNWEAYHTPLDNPQLLDRGSLQHHGENGLALARSLGNADLSQLRERDVTFFGLPPGIFFHYPTSWNWPLAILAGVILLGMMFFSSGAFQTRWSGIILALLANTGLLVICALAGWCFVQAVRWLHLHWLPEGNLLQSVPYVLSMLSLVTALVDAMHLRLRKKLTAAGVSLGGCVLALLAVLATAKWLPGGNFVFLWPLLAALFATGAVAFRPERLRLGGLLLLCLLSLPALLIFIPLLRGFFQALGFTQIGGPLLGLSFALLLILLLPLTDVLLATGRWYVPLASLVGGLCLFGVGAATTRYSDAHPKPTMLAYALDADTGKAVWASTASRLDPWTAQYVGTSPTHGRLPGFYPDWLPLDFLQKTAPLVALAPPEAQLLDGATAGDIRTLHLRITSPRHARALTVSVDQGTVLDASINGHSLGKPADARWSSGGWNFDYSNAGDEGIDLVLQVQGVAPIRLGVTDKSTGLPALPGANLPPRPADSMTFQWGDSTMVRRTFVF
jgi:hypothetical protein